MSATMRAKLKITTVKSTESGDELTMQAVGKHDGYDEEGRDENNTYSQFTPCADLTMFVNNPALEGKFKPGQQFYVDFTLAE